MEKKKSTKGVAEMLARLRETVPAALKEHAEETAAVEPGEPGEDVDRKRGHDPHVDDVLYDPDHEVPYASKRKGKEMRDWATEPEKDEESDEG